jgi:hypothetical protein
MEYVNAKLLFVVTFVNYVPVSSMKLILIRTHVNSGYSYIYDIFMNMLHREQI